MSIMNQLRRVGVVSMAAAAVTLSGCGPTESAAPQPATSSAPAPATSSAAAPSASASPTAEPSATTSDAPLPTATTSQSATSTATASGTTRVSSADGVFSVEMPAGWNQNAASDDAISSITLNSPDGGNLQILSVRYAKPSTTITEQFSRQRNAIVAAYPTCTFPKGADVIKESLGGKVDANYRTFTCSSMPFAFTAFTANGPNGELLVGHDADLAGKADRWKKIIGTVVTAKK